MDNIFNVLVGSASNLKLNAVIEACNIAKTKVGFKYGTIVSHNIKPNIEEQPYGYDETFKGAKYRADGVTKLQSDLDIKYNYISIGIENGIQKCGENYYDFAVIVLKYRGKIYESHSTGIKINEKLLAKSFKRNRHITVGNLMSEKFDSEKDDPHKYLTFGLVTRKDMLVQAILTVLGNLLREL
jgi:non-canonical (house-cleaning) NTP pyrophosphatase